MAKVVMLTALAGEGIDIVCGDVCECSNEQATRFLAVAYAREMDQPGDDKRPVKRLPGVEASGERRVAKQSTPASEPANVFPPPAETTEGEAKPTVEPKPAAKKRPAKRPAKRK